MLIALFPGLTPRAMHLPPLRGSSHPVEGQARCFANCRERRRRERWIAWGVSPRNQKNTKIMKPLEEATGAALF